MMPSATHGFQTEAIRSCQRASDMACICFMPRESRASPSAPQMTMTSSTAYRPGVMRRSGTRGVRFRFRFSPRSGAVGAHHLAALRAEFQERLRFLIEPLALDGVEQCLADDAVDRFRPQVVLVIEAVDSLEHLVGGE